MPDKDKKDIEIIPPGEESRREREPEWIHISFDGTGKSFSEMPLHQRLLLGAASLLGAVVLAFIIFLIVASAVLIWIPLLIAIGVITTLVVFFRRQFRQR